MAGTFTLLECVQVILSAMDSDEVNDINETTESSQVALLLKTVFYDLATDIGLPQQEGLIEVDASGDVAKPTLMTVPNHVARVKWIKYDEKLSTDTNSNYKDVEYMPFEEFLKRQLSLASETTNVGQMAVSFNGDSHNIMYATDKAPTYYTHFDNSQIIFDSYDSSEDTTLQKSKTMCYGWKYPLWTASNSFVPPLDPGQFSYFLNKAKVRAFNEIKQTANQEAISEARRQKVVIQKRKTRLVDEPAVMQAPRYGRK